MPTSFLSADAGFPRLTADVPAEERMRRITDYLYMLLENLQYTLSNLGEENFNEASLDAIEREISDPILQVVADVEGNVSVLEQTAQGLTTRIVNAEGNISTLEQTAQGLTTRISNAEGNISTLQQTDSSLTTRISNAERDISTLEQTASSLTTRIRNAEGDISIAQQTADKINWIVASGTSASNMRLTPEAIDLVAQGINISGYVTLRALETSGQAVINGNNILLKADSTGTSGSYITLLNEHEHPYGHIWTMDTSSYGQEYDDVMFMIDAAGFTDCGTCGLWMASTTRMVLSSGSQMTLKPGGDFVLEPGRGGVFIKSPINTDTKAGHYSFCPDGIYYGNTRILAI